MANLRKGLLKTKGGGVRGARRFIKNEFNCNWGPLKWFIANVKVTGLESGGATRAISDWRIRSDAHFPYVSRLSLVPY